MTSRPSQRKRGIQGRLLPEDDELRNLRGTHRGGIHRMRLAEDEPGPPSATPFRRASFKSEEVPVSTITTFKLDREEAPRDAAPADGGEVPIDDGPRPRGGGAGAVYIERG